MELNEEAEGEALPEPVERLPSVQFEVEIDNQNQWPDMGDVEHVGDVLDVGAVSDGNPVMNVGIGREEEVAAQNPVNFVRQENVPPPVEYASLHNLSRDEWIVRYVEGPVNVAPAQPWIEERIEEVPQVAENNSPEEVVVVEEPVENVPAEESREVIVIDDEDSNEVEEARDDNREEETEEIEMARKKLKLDIKTDKNDEVTHESDDMDSSCLCPICMDYWSNSGEHRLCSLKCGHLFGQSCVLKWLQITCTASNRRCPQCNKKAAVKDIRVIYATNITAIDTVELDNLKKQIIDISADKNRLELELSTFKLRHRLYEEQISTLTKRIDILEKQKSFMSLKLNSHNKELCKKFHLDNTLEISKEGGCRVIDYNYWNNCLAVSQQSTSSLFPGYGVRKIDVIKFQPLQFLLLHTQAIRDISFHPSQQNLLLSVSFDKTAKLMDIHNNVVVHGYPVNGQVWSCCWSGENSNVFHAGTQNGSIMQFDIRQTAGAVDTLQNPGDRSPVVSLASVPPNSSAGMISGGFLATHLNTCYAYEHWNNIYHYKRMFLEGPFVSIRYNTKNNHVLISARPNNKNPSARHSVLSIEKGSGDLIACNIVHTFSAGNSQKHLSRPTFINVDDDTLVAAHQESSECIALWSVNTGRQLSSLTSSDPALDMVSFQVNDNIYLVSLSNKKLRMYNYGEIS